MKIIFNSKMPVYRLIQYNRRSWRELEKAEVYSWEIASFSLIYLQVCKYFLEAVEKKQYGWFWICPNGGKNCHYRHALPPGYVLKSQMKALLEEESEKITIEEEIENQVKIRFFGI